MRELDKTALMVYIFSQRWLWGGIGNLIPVLKPSPVETKDPTWQLEPTTSYTVVVHFNC